MPTPFAISQQVQPSAKAPHHDVPAANPNANEEEKVELANPFSLGTS